ncbi:MAG: Co2+/Mg2+ efflux protein ApaG [Bdellovibrionaceae bacterium]|nr:Co2+/Mg2+ efflux protein ApaG [Pseudobdellovibrionaceae bacterium]
MAVQKQLSPRFDVNVTVSYVDKESRPESGYYFFAYRVRITNKGSVPAQLMSRHWIITDALGQVEEVRGAGVIGVQPRIPPGQHFEYESACPLNSPSGSMRGTYQMATEEGDNFDIEIPEFYLVSPCALH